MLAGWAGEVFSGSMPYGTLLRRTLQISIACCMQAVKGVYEFEPGAPQGWLCVGLYLPGSAGAEKDCCESGFFYAAYV